MVILEVSGLFWSIKRFGVFFVVLKFWGTLVIPMVSRVFWSFQWFRGYFGHSSGFESILVILEVLRYFKKKSFLRFCGGILVILRFLGVLWSFWQFQWYFSHFRCIISRWTKLFEEAKNKCYMDKLLKRMNVWRLYNMRNDMSIIFLQ